MIPLERVGFFFGGALPVLTKDNGFAVGVLAAIIAPLEAEGHTFKRWPKRSTGRDANARLLLGRDCGIDLYLTIEELVDDSPAFSLGGFGYMGKSIPGKEDCEQAIEDAWNRIVTICGDVGRGLGAIQVRRMPEENHDEEIIRKFAFRDQ
jgi:hypothetical protein